MVIGFKYVTAEEKPPLFMQQINLVKRSNGRHRSNA
jgi:hypothetical protein